MRLDIEKQKKLEPGRLAYAFNKLKELGFDPYHGGKSISFIFKGETVIFYPYSGWHTGKSIKDGRGFQKLLDQIKN